MAITRRTSVPRKTVGYVGGGGNAVREQERFTALYDEVGLEAAIAMSDDIVLWKQGRPDDNRLREWARMFDDGIIQPSPKVVANVQKKAANWKKQAHYTDIVRAPGRLAAKIMAKMEDDIANEREFKSNYPVTLSYLFAGANFGMEKGEHGIGKKQTTITAGTLNINAGPPPPKRLRAPKQHQLAAPILEGEFREVGNATG